MPRRVPPAAAGAMSYLGTLFAAERPDLDPSTLYHIVPAAELRAGDELAGHGIVHRVERPDAATVRASIVLAPAVTLDAGELVLAGRP